MRPSPLFLALAIAFAPFAGLGCEVDDVAFGVATRGGRAESDRVGARAPEDRRVAYERGPVADESAPIFVWAGAPLESAGDAASWQYEIGISAEEPR